MYAQDLTLPWDYPLASKELFDALPRPDISIRETWHRVDLPASDLNQELVNWLFNRGLTVPHFDIFIQPPKWTMHIHIDQHDVYDNAAKLNFSYCDAEGYNKMRWYEAEEHTSEIKGNAGGLYRNWEPQHASMVYEHTIKTPTLVNVGKPHNVHNSTDSPRICISLPLIKTKDIPEHIDDDTKIDFLQWEDAMEIFKDCICQNTIST
jgi:hypothetical protein